MKKALVCIALLAAACSTDTSSSDDPYLADSEIFDTEVGGRRVYGVRLFFSSPDQKPRNLGYQVSLYQSDKVWIDTLYTEISANDTVEGEVIFTESRFKKGERTSFKTESFEVE